MEITIKVRAKRAEVIGSPVIVCGNSDYTVTFDLDAEWSDLSAKTARFEFWTNGIREYTNVQFTGTSCRVPVFYDIDRVDIVLCAGDIHTGEPVRIPCIRTISRTAANRPDTKVIISESSGDAVWLVDGVLNESIGEVSINGAD